MQRWRHAVGMFGLSLLVTRLHGQATPTKEWEISFGGLSGRYHQEMVEHRVTAHGQLAYRNKRDATPAVGRISAEAVQEIAGLLDRLGLQRAKKIPSSKWNECIVSQHLPAIWFSLQQGGESYSLQHCNSVGREVPRYAYTLDLNANQRAVYTTLRARLEALFGDELKSNVGTRQQSTGDPLSGVRCWSPRRGADGLDTTHAPNEVEQCRSDNACTLLPPWEIRSVTGRNDLANHAPENWQSATSSDCFHDLALSIRLSTSGWTADRLEAQRDSAARAGHRVESLRGIGDQAYLVTGGAMIGMTGPYTAQTVFVRVGERLLVISLQSFPDDYSRFAKKVESGGAVTPPVVTLARIAVERLAR